MFHPLCTFVFSIFLGTYVTEEKCLNYKFRTNNFMPERFCVQHVKLNCSWNQVGVEWGVPQYNRVTHYKVVLVDEPSKILNEKNVSDTRNIVFTGTKPSRKYTIKVKAFQHDGRWSGITVKETECTSGRYPDSDSKETGISKRTTRSSVAPVYTVISKRSTKPGTSVAPVYTVTSKRTTETLPSTSVTPVCSIISANVKKRRKSETIEGKPLLLNCKVNSDCDENDMKISWYKDGKDISQHNKATIWNRFRQPAHRNDSGNYVCKVSVRRRNLSSSSTEFNVNVKYSYITIHASSTKITVTENGKPPNISCSYDCNPPCDNLALNKNGAYNKRLKMDESLFGKTLQRSDSGNYSCTAINGSGQVKQSKTITVNVQYGPSKPKIKGNITRFVLRHKWEPLICEAECNPECVTDWMVNGTVISYRTSWPYFAQFMWSSVSGTYMCRVSNRISYSTSDPLVVDVLGPPSNVNIQGTKQHYYENENITLTCKTSNKCNPRCLFKWLKGIGSGKTFHSKGDSLTFPRLQRSDESYYTCEASNSVGTKTSYTYVDVSYAHASINTKNRVIKIDIKKRFPNVKCRADCSPPCNKYVLKNNRSTDRSTYLFPNKRSTKADSGVYKCKVEQRRGQSYFEVFSESITLYVTYNVVIINPSTNRSVQEGETLSDLMCSHQCSPPCRNLQMYKDNVFKKNLHQNATLFWKVPLQRSDSGLYSCKASSSAGETIASEPIFIDVVYGPIITKEPTENITIKENATLELQWSFDANPDIVGIMFNLSSHRPNVLGNKNNYTLKFEKLDRKDTGRYTLHAWNSRQSLWKQYNIFVLSAPRITKGKSTESVQIYEKYRTDIHVTGYPPPDMKILHRSMTGINTTVHGNNYRIMISNVTKDHYGKYEIVWQNSEGNEKINFTLIPSGPPLKPSNVAASCIDPEKAHITWVPQFPGESAQTFFIERKTNSTWEIEGQNISEPLNGTKALSYTVINLQAGIVHAFRVKAINIAGAKYSDETNCTVLAFKQSLASSTDASSIVVVVAASVVILILATVLLVVLLLRQKRRNIQKNSQDQLHGAFDGVHDNVLYGMSPLPTEVSAPQASTSATASSSSTSKMAPPSSTNDTELAHDNDTKTLETGDAVYATVNKGGKGKANESDGTENKKAKRSQKLKSKKKPSRTKNEDGLLYVEVEFANQVSGPSSKIIGIENKTEYVEIDFTKRADPLPDESSGSDSNTN